MTNKNDRIGRIGRLEALLEKIRQRSALPRGLNGVTAGAGVAHLAAEVAPPEDTEVRISATFDEHEHLEIVDVPPPPRPPLDSYEAETINAAALAPVAAPPAPPAPPVSVTEQVAAVVAPASVTEQVAAVVPALAAEQVAVAAPVSAEQPVMASPAALERAAAEAAAMLEQEPVLVEDAEAYGAMLDEYEVSEDVVEIHVDAEDDSVRTSVPAGVLEAPAPFEAPAAPRASSARLSGASGVILSEGEDIVVGEGDLVSDLPRDVTIDVEEAAPEPPTSSRRPIAIPSVIPSDLPAHGELPPEDEAPFSPPPASGKQIAAADYGFDPAPATLHPVAPIETPPRRDPLTSTMRSSNASADERGPSEYAGHEGRYRREAYTSHVGSVDVDVDPDAPRQIWKATSPPPQVEPDTFGSWLDATLSL